MKNEDLRYHPKNRMRSTIETVYPLFQESSSKPEPLSKNASNGVQVKLHEILPTLSFAFENGLLWVEDFEHEFIQIPQDLRDIIAAIQKIQKRNSN